MSEVAEAVVGILVWGVLATVAMTSILFASQNLGWSRLNLPFLLGTVFTGERHVANVLGFVLYLLGGCVFAFFYYLVFAVLGAAGWRVGALVGLAHGVLLLTTVFPLLPYAHPRVASEYDGPGGCRRLEPPGFLALNYGRSTPLVALVAHGVYGAVLGNGLAGSL